MWSGTQAAAAITVLGAALICAERGTGQGRTGPSSASPRGAGPIGAGPIGARGVPGARVPGGQVPGTQVPGTQVPGALVPGAGGDELTEFDRVVAVIGDRVVLDSEVKEQVRAKFQDEKQPEKNRQYREDILRAILRREIWVQYGKVLGQQAPEAFEEIVQRQVEEHMDEQIEEWGSFQKMVEELESIGSSWQEVEDEYRQRLLAQIAQRQAIGQRYFENRELLVTPKEMKAFFDANPQNYEARKAATIEWLSFSKSGDPDAAQANADAAARAWRTGVDDLQAIKDQFKGAIIPPKRDIPYDDPDDATRSFIKEFARDNPNGTVSAPIDQQRFFLVLRVSDKIDTPQRPFTDETVQTEIREILIDRRMIQMNNRLMLQQLRNLRMWYADGTVESLIGQ